MNSDGSNQHVLLGEASFFDYFPSFSPDGSQVVFTRCTLPAFHCAIYRMGINRDNLTALTQYDPNPDVNDFAPEYSPDGTTIAFEGFTRGGVIAAIYLMNADGSNVHKLDRGSEPRAPRRDGIAQTLWHSLLCEKSRNEPANSAREFSASVRDGC